MKTTTTLTSLHYATSFVTNIGTSVNAVKLYFARALPTLYKAPFLLMVPVLLCIYTNIFAQQTFVKRIFTGYKTGDANITTATNGDQFVTQNIFNDSNTRSDFYCLRLDNKGKKIWEKSYNPLNSTTQQYNKVIATRDNGLLLFAKTYDNMLKQHAATVMKCDSLGNVAWSKKILGSPGNNYFDGILAMEDQEGNYVLVYVTFSLSATEKMQLIKLNKNGEIILQQGWDHIYDEGTYQNFTPRAITERYEKGYLVAVSYDCGWCQTGPRSYLLATNENGKVVSYKNYRPAHRYYWSDYPMKLIRKDEQYYMLGELETFDYESTKYYYYLAPIDRDGNPGNVGVVNTNIFAVQQYLAPIQLDFGTIVRTAYTKKSMTSLSTYGDYTNGYGLLVGKYNASGRICPAFDAPVYDYDTSTITMNVGAPVQGMRRFVDAVVFTDRYVTVTDVEYSKTNCSLKMPDEVSAVTSTNLKKQEALASLYPNPAKSFIMLSYNAEKSGTLNLSLTATNGKELQKQKITVQKGMNLQTINVSALSNGIYFIRIIQNGRQRVLKFIKE